MPSGLVPSPDEDQRRLPRPFPRMLTRRGGDPNPPIADCRWCMQDDSPELTLRCGFPRILSPGQLSRVPLGDDSTLAVRSGQNKLIEVVNASITSARLQVQRCCCLLWHVMNHSEARNWMIERRTCHPITGHEIALFSCSINSSLVRVGLRRSSIQAAHARQNPRCRGGERGFWRVLNGSSGAAGQGSRDADQMRRARSSSRISASRDSVVSSASAGLAKRALAAS